MGTAPSPTSARTHRRTECSGWAAAVLAEMAGAATEAEWAGVDWAAGATARGAADSEEAATAEGATGEEVAEGATEAAEGSAAAGAPGILGRWP